MTRFSLVSGGLRASRAARVSRQGAGEQGRHFGGAGPVEEPIAAADEVLTRSRETPRPSSVSWSLGHW